MFPLLWLWLWFLCFEASSQLPRLLLFDRRRSHHLFPFLALPSFLTKAHRLLSTSQAVFFFIIFYISLSFFSPPCCFSLYHTIINITCKHPQFYQPRESTNGARRKMNVDPQSPAWLSSIFTNGYLVIYL